MTLRKLKLKDAGRMHEWMHNDFVVHFMEADFSAKKLKDCQHFISISKKDTENWHRAIVNDNDIYMGTVSLKHIDNTDRCAEFAIIVCEDAMGKGYAKFGMNEIIRMGFDKLKLDRIYWYVSKENERAIRFYNKNGYQKTTSPPKDFGNYISEQSSSYYWYSIDKE